MLLSGSMAMLMPDFTCEECVEIMTEAGFDGLDFPFFRKEFHIEECEGKEFENRLKKLKAMAEEKGARFNQAHAPEGSSIADEEWTKRRFREIVRSMKNASILGADIIVVHPMQHLPYCEEGVPEKLFEMNMDFYNRLKPYCEEYGIKVALENMWQLPAGKKIDHSTCSRPDEFIKYLEGLNSQWFTGCLDIGHAALVSEDPAEFIRKMGSNRLKALHVHDVDGWDDSHTIPYQGIINWEKVASALKEIGYEGDFTYETTAFLTRTPKSLKTSGTRFAADIGRYIIDKINR